MAVTFEETSPIDFATLYDKGYSINDLAKIMHCSYTRARNILLKSGIKLRTKKEAFAVLMRRHPEWREQFVKYKITSESRRLSKQKIKLLILILTEGCIWKNRVQFTNNHIFVRDLFSELVREIYNVDGVRTRGNVAYIEAKEIADDLRAYDIKRMIPNEVMNEILRSPSLTKEVLRLFADTEGAVIISIRRTPRNYTVGDRRVVIALTNQIVKRQVIRLFKSLKIAAKEDKCGVSITNEGSLRLFALKISFSPGIRVVRKKAGHGIWYGYEKAILLRLLVRIYDEQIKRGRGAGRHEGVFRDCKTADDVFKILNSWYNKLKGG